MESLSGATRAETAVKSAISCPLLDETSIEGATRILVNFTSSSTTMTFHEVQQAMDIIREAADSEADVIFGLVYDDEMKEEIKVTLIATGFNRVWQDKTTTDGFDINDILGESFELVGANAACTLMQHAKDETSKLKRTKLQTLL